MYRQGLGKVLVRFRQGFVCIGKVQARFRQGFVGLGKVQARYRQGIRQGIGKVRQNGCVGNS